MPKANLKTASIQRNITTPTILANPANAQPHVKPANQNGNKPAAVILAAGRGRRLWPVGEALPKCMIRVLGKPLIEWVLDAVLPHSQKVVIVVGYKKELVTEYFSKKPYANQLEFVEQAEQKGTAHALLQAKGRVNGPFFTINGDSFAEPRLYREFVQCIQQKPDQWIGMAKNVDDARPFGLIHHENGRIKSFEEKPKRLQSGLVALGNYYLPEAFFSYLEKVTPSARGEYELTDALNTFCREHELYAHAFDGFRTEVTYFWDHLDLNIHALENLMDEKHEGTIENGAILEGKLFLGKGSIIKAGSRIEGPAYIGEDCLIGPNAFIRRGSVIENNCHVGTCEIKNSVVMNGANVPHFSYIGDSVLCEDVNLGAGTMIANLRFDNGPVQVRFKEGVVDSGRRKLGTAIGSGTKIGVNCSINCGVLIGHNCKIYPGVQVKHNLDNETIFKGDFGNNGKQTDGIGKGD